MKKKMRKYDNRMITSDFGLDSACVGDVVAHGRTLGGWVMIAYV